MSSLFSAHSIKSTLKVIGIVLTLFIINNLLT
jgi:hypothetical protein